jgi:hypothetical protein
MCASAYWELVFKDVERKVSKKFSTLLWYFNNYSRCSYISDAYDERNVL